MSQKMLVYVAEYLTKPGFTQPDRLGVDIFCLACRVYRETERVQTSHEKYIRVVEFERLCNILERNFPKNARRYEKWKELIQNICLEDRKAWSHVFMPDFYYRICKLHNEQLFQAH